MSKPHIKPAYAKLDPAHTFDGLFVPTKGKKRDKLLVGPRRFGDIEISFQGFEQLGADDQSILLALTAQLGIKGMEISGTPQGPISAQLRASLAFSKDDGASLASGITSLRSLMIDAGYSDHESSKALKTAKDCLNRLANVQIREIDHKTGWDRRCNLISTTFNHKTRETYVAANPRLTRAVFSGQHIKVSLFERNELDSEVAKLLHCWFCSNIRLGRSLGNGNGTKLETLAPHVWGDAWDGFSASSKSKKRSQVRDALDEIQDRTRGLQGGHGWIVDQTSSGLVMVSRPKELPFLEAKHEMTPSEFHEIMTEQYDYQEPSIDYEEWLPPSDHPTYNEEMP